MEVPRRALIWIKVRDKIPLASAVTEKPSPGGGMV
jgi:hypothetical protein